jgi:hypothetical protein
MTNLVILPSFTETNPPTVNELNLYFAAMASAINSMAGEMLIAFSADPQNDAYLYAPIAGADFHGSISAESMQIGLLKLPVPVVFFAPAPPIEVLPPAIWINTETGAQSFLCVNDGELCWAEAAN